MSAPDAPTGQRFRRVETWNSVYVLDSELNRYLRLPRGERPREWWEMTGADSEWMADGTWMPYEEVLTLDIMDSDLRMLQIVYPGARVGIRTTPIVYDSAAPDADERFAAGEEP